MTRAWFLWFMMSPGPIDGVVAPLFTIALLFILCNKWLQFNHQSKLLKHLVGNCDVTVVVSMAMAIPSGRLMQREPAALSTQRTGVSTSLERETWGTSPDTGSVGKNPLTATGDHMQCLENWDVNLTSLDRLVALISCREIFRKNSKLLCRDGKQNYLSCTVLFCLGLLVFFFPSPVQVDKKD